MSSGTGLRQRRRTASNAASPEEPRVAEAPERNSAIIQLQEVDWRGLAEDFLTFFLAALEVCMQKTPLGTVAERLGLRQARNLAPRAPTEQELDVLLLERALLSTPVHREDHEELWKRLWVGWHRSNNLAVPSFAIPSEHWTDMGFQGRDPGTDIRGGGLLALMNLVYFVERYPSDVAAMTAQHRNAERDDSSLGPQGPPTYPWAAGAIAITHCVAKALRIAKPMRGGAVLAASTEEIRTSLEPYWAVLLPPEDDQGNSNERIGTAGAVENPQLRDVFCMAFRRFNEIWFLRSARYFEFPAVLEELTNALTRDLTDRASARERMEDNDEHGEVKTQASEARRSL